MKSGVVSTSTPVSIAQIGVVKTTNLAPILDSGAIQNLIQHNASAATTAVPTMPVNLALAAQTVKLQPISPIANAQVASLKSGPMAVAVVAPTGPQPNALE